MRYSKLHTTHTSRLRKTPRGLAPSFTRPQRRSQSDQLHNGYGTPSPIHLLREGTVGRTTVPRRHPAFTFTVLRTDIATSYCSPIPHLKTATAASSIISRLEQEAAASFQNLSTLAPLPGVALEFARLNLSSAIFVFLGAPADRFFHSFHRLSSLLLRSTVGDS
jgi:hypothetical protein